MTCRVLCTGDLHIGRRASKVPGIYRTADAWDQTVDVAIEEGVDVVALSGDIIDQANAAYEAFGPFQGGLRRLDDHSIQTVAVAGNHDFDALPRIASAVESSSFRVLGEGGNWEHQVVDIDGTPALSVVGWSFPTEHVQVNPLSSMQEQPSSQLPVLGLLHADVGASRSKFAPVMPEGLWAVDGVFWLLGHIHVPGVIDGPGSRMALYPGSPWAMDPGEPGVHGVWIAEFAPGQPVELEQLHISPIRYVSTSLDVSDVEDEDGFFRTVTSALDDIGVEALRSDNRSRLQDISCRIDLHGASIAHRLIPGWAGGAEGELTHRAAGRVDLRIEQITCRVNPPVDLAQLSSGNDPVAETARLLLALSNESLEEPYADLVEQTRRKLVTIFGNPGYSALLSEDREAVVVEPTEQDARDRLTKSGWNLLSSLLAQKAET